MVCAPHVDDMLELAVYELVVVICNVGSEVSRHAGGANQDIVLILSESG